MTDEAGRRLLAVFDAVGEAALVYGLLVLLFAVSPIVGIVVYRRFRGQLIVVGGALGGVVGAVPMALGSSTAGDALVLLGVGGTYGVLIGLVGPPVMACLRDLRRWDSNPR